MIYAGIDSGSRTIKLVLYDAVKGDMIARAIRDQGIDQADLSASLYRETLREKLGSAAAVAGSVATGYGRNALEFADAAVTEITCHAVGVLRLHPEARTIVDIGGEDSKVIRLNDAGRVQDFVMNDRCAAGTGRFLEIVARRLEGDLDEVARAAADSSDPAAISSMCVVFAETEIVGLLASGVPRQDIMAGVQASVASRVAGMVGNRGRGPVYLTGGVARIPGMAGALSRALGQPVAVARHPQFTGALGAAILASRQNRSLNP